MLNSLSSSLVLLGAVSSSVLAAPAPVPGQGLFNRCDRPNNHDRPDYNRPDYNRPDYNRPDRDRPDYNRFTSTRPTPSQSCPSSCAPSSVTVTVEKIVYVTNCNPEATPTSTTTLTTITPSPNPTTPIVVPESSTIGEETPSPTPSPTPTDDVPESSTVGEETPSPTPSTDVPESSTVGEETSSSTPSPTPTVGPDSSSIGKETPSSTPSPTVPESSTVGEEAPSSTPSPTPTVGPESSTIGEDTPSSTPSPTAPESSTVGEETPSSTPSPSPTDGPESSPIGEETPSSTPSSTPSPTTRPTPLLTSSSSYVIEDGCTDFYLGQHEKQNTEGQTAQVCASISGDNLTVTFDDVQDYDYKETQVWIGCSAPNELGINSAPGQLGAELAQFCDPFFDTDSPQCHIPLSYLEEKCGGELCDKTLWIATHGALNGTSDETGWGMGQCWDGEAPQASAPICPGKGNWAQFWNFTVECPVPDEPTPTPTPTPDDKVWCKLGTGFGYSENPVSLPLNGLSGNTKGCNRWGWYIPASSEDLVRGITGEIYVGAGQNDISKADRAGGFEITKTDDAVNVRYNLDAGYDLSEVHVSAECNKEPTKCSPGGYNFVSGPNDNLDTTNEDQTFTATFPNAQYPELAQCDGTTYFILHASVNKAYDAPHTCGGATPEESEEYEYEETNFSR